MVSANQVTLEWPETKCGLTILSASPMTQAWPATKRGLTMAVWTPIGELTESPRRPLSCLSLLPNKLETLTSNVGKTRCKITWNLASTYLGQTFADLVPAALVLVWAVDKVKADHDQQSKVPNTHLATRAVESSDSAVCWV